MNFQKFKPAKIIVMLLSLSILTVSGLAQQDSSAKKVKPSIIYDENDEDTPIAMRNNLYCAGYIQKSRIDTSLEVVGADNEKDKNIFSEGDEMYISKGARNGIKVGDMFSVIRPRGRIKSKFSKKKNLGIYIQEVGAVKVVKVMDKVSVARVATSCSVVLLGDLLMQTQKRVSPVFKKRPALDRFADSSGGVSGRIVMARDGVELIGRENIVYVDLGREDNVRAGDYLTVYRPLGTGNIYRKELSEHMDNKEGGFESNRYKGGRFSNMAPRKKGSKANGSTATTENVKSRREKGLRRIVGELVVLNVLERTATAIVVRTTSEIHPGDHVEVQ